MQSEAQLEMRFPSTWLSLPSMEMEVLLAAAIVLPETVAPLPAIQMP